MYRDTFTLAPAELTSAELEKEFARVESLWEMHLDQLRQGYSSEFRDRSMTKNKKRGMAILREIKRRAG